MNSLSNGFYNGYKVTTVFLDGYPYPYYIEFNVPEQSRIWLHDLRDPEVKSKFGKHFEPVKATQLINGV